MFNFVLEDIFNVIPVMNQFLKSEINEIIVQYDKMIIYFNEIDFVPAEDIGTIIGSKDCFNYIGNPNVVLDENGIITIEIDELFDLSTDEIELLGVYPRILYQIITTLRQAICLCPNLEFIISSYYMKIFIDVPNIKLSTLFQIQDIFGEDPFVETYAVQNKESFRPHLLFFNIAQMEQDVSDEDFD